MKIAVVLLGVIILNPWFWRIVKEDLIISFVLIIFNFILYGIAIEKKIKVWLVVIALMLFSVLSFIILKSAFDKTLQSLSPEDLVKLNQRHFYYSQELGKIFLNSKALNFYKNYSLTVYKLEGNLFSNLDLNLYFFASHPRERTGINEFEKYSLLFLPFFVIGVLLLIYRESVWMAGYLIAASLVSSLITSNYIVGPILFFPLINICIIMGIIYILDLLKVLKK